MRSNLHLQLPPKWMLMDPHPANIFNHIFKWANPSLLAFSTIILEKKCWLRRNSNWDRQSIRQACLPLHHYYNKHFLISQFKIQDLVENPQYSILLPQDSAGKNFFSSSVGTNRNAEKAIWQRTGKYLDNILLNLNEHKSLIKNWVNIKCYLFVQVLKC